MMLVPIACEKAQSNFLSRQINALSTQTTSDHRHTNQISGQMSPKTTQNILEQSHQAITSQ